MYIYILACTRSDCSSLLYFKHEERKCTRNVFSVSDSSISSSSSSSSSSILRYSFLMTLVNPDSRRRIVEKTSPCLHRWISVCLFKSHPRRSSSRNTLRYTNYERQSRFTSYPTECTPLVSTTNQQRYNFIVANRERFYELRERPRGERETTWFSLCQRTERACDFMLWNVISCWFKMPDFNYICNWNKSAGWFWIVKFFFVTIIFNGG